MLMHPGMPGQGQQGQALTWLMRSPWCALSLADQGDCYDPGMVQEACCEYVGPACPLVQQQIAQSTPKIAVRNQLC
jgi:hypothetical protein